jgi:hypothetical protein
MLIVRRRRRRVNPARPYICRLIRMLFFIERGTRRVHLAVVC